MSFRGGNSRNRSRVAGLGGSAAGGGTPPPPVVPSNSMTFAQATPDSFGNYTYARGTAATYSDSGNVLRNAASNVARFEYMGTTAMGLKMEGGNTNFCSNNNFNPLVTTDLTNSGGALAVVADPANYLTTAVYDYGNTVDLKTGVCTNGNVVSFTGVAGNYVEFPGSANSTVNAHTGSVYMVSSVATALSYGATAATLAVAANTKMTRQKISFIPADMTSKLRITLNANRHGLFYSQSA